MYDDNDTQTNPKMSATGVAKETVRITACYKNHTWIKWIYFKGISV